MIFIIVISFMSKQDIGALEEVLSTSAPLVDSFDVDLVRFRKVGKNHCLSQSSGQGRHFDPQADLLSLVYDNSKKQQPMLKLTKLSPDDHLL